MISHKFVKTVIPAILIIAGLILIGVAIYKLSGNNHNPVPQDIQQRLNFAPFVVPSDNPNFRSENFQIISSENDEVIFSYTLSGNAGRFQFSQYIQPPQFTDIPEYKEQFLTSVVQQQTTIPTSSGTIYVGQLTKQNNAPIGVMIERGLIVMIRPSQPINEADWRDLGESLEIVKL